MQFIVKKLYHDQIFLRCSISYPRKKVKCTFFIHIACSSCLIVINVQDRLEKGTQIVNHF